MAVRCINLDWLELYCLEPADEPRDASFFTRRGYIVQPRQYGTPQYREMFTIFENEDEFIEVRRDPYSTTDVGGVFPRGACHLRLTNRTCYERDPIGHLRMFLITNGYTIKALSRVDIALDFVQFDNTDWQPRTFVAAYMRGEVSKVNQSHVAAHGFDYWANRIWNSLKWGSVNSPVTTKMYNKTMELREQEDKDYIRQRWIESGFSPTDEVWRIEFSASSQMQSLKSKTTGHVFKRDLTSYSSRERLLFQFQVFMTKYFDFRLCVRNRDGSLKRKYECPRLNLFHFANDAPYTPVRNVAKSRFIGRTWKVLTNKLKPLMYDTSLAPAERDACRLIFALMMRARAAEWRQLENDTQAEALQLECYRQGLNLEEIIIRAQLLEERERELMYSLMRKFGITATDDTLPF